MCIRDRFYADPLYPLLHGLWDLTGYGDRLQKAIDTLAPLKDCLLYTSRCV